VSTDNGQTWLAQCGNYTVLGTSGNGSVQPANKPLWDGVQSTWVLEEINLSEYLGQQIKVRFQLRSDGGTRADGFYFDDFSIYANEIDDTGLESLGNSQLLVSPNPSQQQFQIQGLQQNAPYQILHSSGKIVQSGKVAQANQLFDLEEAAGIYYFQTILNEQPVRVKIMLLD
jgi:bacillopeptidase F (M6 metalloprotease family)